MQNIEGEWVEDENEIEKIMVGYFKEIFTNSNFLEQNYALDVVDTCIITDMTAFLQEPFTEAKILESLHQIHPTHGPHGMPVFFFHKFQQVVEKEVLHTCLVIVNNNMDPSSLNKTHIVLIPKVTSPKSIKDFKPISLCIVVFKTIIKTIKNRLKKKIFPNIIHKTQSAFCLRQINNRQCPHSF